MDEQMNPLAVTHLLQHTLRSLCIHENSQWVYAVFWRILPRNYPPPKWDGQGAYDRSRGNRRNWILVWEDGFCNFAASTTTGEMINSSSSGELSCPNSSSSVYGNCEFQHYQGLQPELFFKMSHEIYNYGEGLVGKVAADHSHKWIYKEPNDQAAEINFLSAWHNSADSHPRTWEAQFQSGIKTIALIAVREGVVQLGAVDKVDEDLSYVVLLRKKFSYIESIPGVLLPHPSSSALAAYHHPFKIDQGCTYNVNATTPEAAAAAWHYHQFENPLVGAPPPADQYYHHDQMKMITPSMSSLEALLSKLPSVVPPGAGGGGGYCVESHPPPVLSHFATSTQIMPMAMEFSQMEKVAAVAKEEEEAEAEAEAEETYHEHEHHDHVGECSSSMSGYQHHHFHHHHHRI